MTERARSLPCRAHHRPFTVNYPSPNGPGKTTTFYMIVGLVRPDGGEVILGDDITGLPMYLRAMGALWRLMARHLVAARTTAA